MPYANPEEKRANDRRYYLAHREERKAYIKAWQAENKERVDGYKKAWLDAHPDYKRQWYLANREVFLAQCKAYRDRRREEEPERMREIGRITESRRRARKMKAFVEDVNHQDVWERDGGICQICGEPADVADWHLDHIVPLVRGGEHSYANTQVAHPLCNWRKAAS
jgi:5-methylcytosine-specific restriction endonuclease McrA